VLIAFGALYAGIPFCPVSPAYSLVSRGLRQARLSDEAADARPRVRRPMPRNSPMRWPPTSLRHEIAASHGAVPGRDVTTLADLMADAVASAPRRVHEAIGPDTIAKFLLTSGSTGNPKAVINTQRMICANQVMLRETLAFLKDEPPVIVDWLPWNHTFGGNHNIGLTLYNGGSMYLDEGKPMPGGIEETVRNLQEISPTVYFNVPKGYESLLPYLRDDGRLRKKFFRRCMRCSSRAPRCRRSCGTASTSFRSGDRLSRADADRSWRHRNRAVLHVGQSAHQPLRPCRAAGFGQ
jgi:feruloyl-CoA synthase